jgi:hypothetical protein
MSRKRHGNRAEREENMGRALGEDGGSMRSPDW